MIYPDDFKLLNSFLTNKKKCWPKGRRFMNYQKKEVCEKGKKKKKEEFLFLVFHT